MNNENGIYVFIGSKLNSKIDPNKKYTDISHYYENGGNDVFGRDPELGTGQTIIEDFADADKILLDLNRSWSVQTKDGKVMIGLGSGLSFGANFIVGGDRGGEVTQESLNEALNGSSGKTFIFRKNKKFTELLNYMFNKKKTTIVIILLSSLLILSVGSYFAIKPIYETDKLFELIKTE
jgi:hypothetical protein